MILQNNEWMCFILLVLIVYFIYTLLICTNILKIGPNRPVQPVGPRIRVGSSPVVLLKSLVDKNWSKIEKIGLNRIKLFEPKSRNRFCKTVGFKKMHQIEILNFHKTEYIIIQKNISLHKTGYNNSEILSLHKSEYNFVVLLYVLLIYIVVLNL